MFTTFAPMDEKLEIKKCDVLIAGSGPIGAAFARTILTEYPTAKVCMVEIGAQDSPTVGAHHKNAVKFQKDIDAFVHIIQGALQPISVPPADTFMSTLGEVAWVPPPGKHIIQSSHNPLQKAEENLKSFVTRTVGGMATHWTCACPFPHEEEYKDTPVPKEDFKKLLEEAKLLLDVNLDQYDDSIRHTLVKNALAAVYKEHISNLPLAVRRNENNREFVTWSGVDTILKDTVKKLELITETRVTRLIADKNTPGKVKACQVRDLMNNVDYYIEAKQYVIACGAVGTPQVLWNSGIRPEALGCYLAEQSLTFCQIVLKKSIIATIPTLNEEKDKTLGGKGKTKAELAQEHVDQHKKDTLPIPFNDPEPQVTIKYTHDKPWHVQIHRDAFAYGGVGPRADPRTVVDLRFFGRQEIRKENRVYFDDSETKAEATKDGYGMPQATFEVTRTAKDAENDHRMMNEMCNVASVLGAYLPGSEPQFMEPGLVLHITGTTRLGTYDKKDKSVADSYSKVHDIDNLYVGGNGVIPDSTACNPTLTSVAYALRAARSLGAKLGLPKAQAA